MSKFAEINAPQQLLARGPVSLSGMKLSLILGGLKSLFAHFCMERKHISGHQGDVLPLCVADRSIPIAAEGSMHVLPLRLYIMALIYAF